MGKEERISEVRRLIIELREDKEAMKELNIWLKEACS